MFKIGEQLAKLRKEHNYKQTDVAEKLQVSQQVISNIERGITLPDINFLKSAADLYGVSLDKLVGRDFNDYDADSIEKQIIGCIQQMNDAGKELSLGLISQVAQSQENKNGK